MYLLSCVAFEFTDVLSLHTLEVLYNLRVNILSQGVWPSRDEPRESEGVSILLVLESERKEGGQNWNFVFGGVPKWSWRDGPKKEHRSARKTR